MPDVIPLASGWHYSPYSLILGLSAALALPVAAIVWRRRTVPGAVPFVLLLVAAAEWAAVAAIEHAAVSPAVKLLCAKVEYLGIVAVSPLWLTFALAYTERTAWLTRRRQALLWVIPGLTLVLAWTNEWHHLVWSRITPSSAVPGAPLVYGHGPWFWLAAAYNYVLNLTGATTLVIAVARSAQRYRSQSAALLTGLAFPWIGNALYLAGLSPLRIDTTPLALTLTGLVYVWGVFRLQLFDLMPVARHRLIESMTDAVVVLDEEHRVVDVNPSARRLLGLAAVEVGDRADSVLAAWPALRESEGAEARAQVRVETAEGPRELDLRITALRDPAGHRRGRLIVARDVTAETQAAEALRHGEKLAALGRLAAGVAHELTNPLAVIDGRLQMMRLRLARDVPDAATLGTYLANLAEATERMRHIVQGLTNYARPAKAEPTLIEIAELLANTVELVTHPAQAAQVMIVLDVPPGLPPVLGERSEMTQILVNLAINAIEAMAGRGGTMTLAARLERVGDEPRVGIEVSDTGGGIPPEDRQRIWEPFYTTKPAGTGLGLSIVRALADKQPGASIVVESRVGAGTTFRLTMPAGSRPGAG